MTKLTLSEGLAKIKRLIEQQSLNTDDQRQWHTRLVNAEKILSKALDVEARLAASPDDAELKGLFVICRGQVMLALRSIIKGAKTYQRNHDKLYEEPKEERRARERQEYADKIMREENRVSRKNARRCDYTPEEWAAREREREKIKKAKQRANKKIRISRKT